MLLECSTCSATVEAQEIASYLDDDESNNCIPGPGKWTFARCPRCTLPLLAVQYDFGDGHDADWPTRVYPPRDRQLGMSVPKSIRIAFDEATVCFKAKAYTASAIMCRKTLEGLCDEHGVKEKNLSLSLKKLKEAGVIEARIFEWAEALRTLGNEAAHGVSSAISLQDAKDILEFTEALAEYVFTYRDKFESFQKRLDRTKRSEDADV
jgi:Domain of unknown function (DUF4145)